MKVNELRIGNWVYDGDENLIVKGVQYGKIYTINGLMYMDDIKPIPLTPEILEQCGFLDMDTVHVNRLNDVLTLIAQENFKENCFVYAHYFANGYNMCLTDAPITYLHQLQNLFFALTGTELSFTPKPSNDE